MNRRVWAAAGLLIFIIGLRAAAQWIWHLRLGGHALLDVENADRIAFLWGWVQSPSFWVRSPYSRTEDYWLPFFFWVHGGFMSLCRDPLFAPRLLNAVLSNLCLFPFYGVARRLADGSRWGASAATCAAAFMPLGFKVGLDAYFEPLFVLLLLSWLYFWLRWLESPRALWHGLSVVCLAAAAMTRYEAWLFVAAFLALTRRRPLFGWRCLAAAPVLLCLAHQAASRGYPWFLADISRPAAYRVIPNWGHIELILKHVFSGGTLLPLAALGAMKSDLRRAGPRDILGLTAAPFLLFAAAVLVLDAYLGHEHLAPFQLLVLLWTAPLAEGVLRGVSDERKTILVLSSCLLWWAPLVTRRPSGVTSRQAAELSAALRRAGPQFFGKDAAIIKLPSVGYDQSRPELLPQIADPRLFELALLPAGTVFDRDRGYDKQEADGGKFIHSRRPGAASLFDAQPRELRRILRERAIRLVIVCGDAADEALGREWTKAWSSRAYHVYGRRGDTLTVGLRDWMSPYPDERDKKAASSRAPARGSPPRVNRQG